MRTGRFPNSLTEEPFLQELLAGPAPSGHVQFAASVAVKSPDFKKENKNVHPQIQQAVGRGTEQEYPFTRTCFSQYLYKCSRLFSPSLPRPHSVRLGTGTCIT